jgi:putative transposase
LVLAVVVTAASVDDAVGATRVVGPATSPRLRVIFGDSKYHNYAYYQWLEKQSDGQWHMEISQRPREEKGFKPLRIRWVIERSFAWLGCYRRLSKDYERYTDTSENRILLSSIDILLKRLRPPKQKDPPFCYRKQRTG